MTRPTAVCIMGPTASGKTDLALALARDYPFEIVSVDSALVYRGMDIGTAKPSPEILAEYVHHLVDIREPTEPYSAADFRADALKVMDEIASRGHIPLLVGGTMLYFKALVSGLAELPSADAAVRARISAVAETQGWPAIHARLAEVDPEAAARIHPNDPQRLQRALEVYEISGRSQSEMHRAGTEPCPWPLLQIGVMPPDRKALHQRIEVRFDAMLAAGLVEEVRQLKAQPGMAPGLPSMKAVGYRQVWAHLDGEYDYDQMRHKGIVATRQLAKRQYTWLRSWSDAHIIEAADPSAVLKIMDAGSILD